MSRFIKFKHDHPKQTVYINVSQVSEARFDHSEETLELTVGDADNNIAQTALFRSDLLGCGPEAVVIRVS